MPVAMIDILAAHQMKEAILVALISKAKGETGCIIHVSLFHSAISALVNQATNFLMEGYIAEPMGTLHPNIAPYGEMSTTLDGHLIIWAIGSDLQFEKLMNYFKISIQDFPQFATNKKRVLNRIELQSLLNEACKKFTYSQISSYCDQASIPYGNVKTIDKVLSSPDAQSMIKSNDISQMDKGKYISNVAFKIDFND
jgi:crotonobetainyl-CoA:carnitine CoA-transferase CaiB-like acyl-CoA transferase